MSDHQKVRKAIIERINNGSYQPGKPIDSLRNVARSTGSSIGTVGRAITHLVTEGYLQPRRGKRFVVGDRSAGAAADLRTVGLLSTNVPAFPDTEAHGMFRDATTAIQIELDRHGAATLLVSATRWLGEVRKRAYLEIDELAEKGLQGLLVLGVYDVTYLKKLQAKIPVVVALDVDAGNEGVDSVAFDNRMSAAVLVKKLVEMGARRIAFAGGPTAPSREGDSVDLYDPCAKERYDGWRIGMHTAGLNPDPSLAAFAPRRGSGDFMGAVASVLTATRWPLGFQAMFCRGMPTVSGLRQWP